MSFYNKQEGIDFILLRKIKTSFGDKKHKPHTIPRSTISKPNCKCKQCGGDNK